MMNRLAILFVGLSLGCASSAPKKAATQSPEMPTPAWEGGDRTPEMEGAPRSSSGELLPMAKLPFAEAKERADHLWMRADTQKTSAPAWEEAAEALALAAEATAEEPVAAVPLLKGALAAWSNSDKIQTPQSGGDKSTETRQALPRRDALQITVLDQLTALSDAESPGLAMVAYRHGRILYRYAHYTEAASQFAIVVERFPEREEAKYAGALLLDSIQRSGDTGRLSTQADAMLKNKKLIDAHAELSETLLLIRHQSSLHEVQTLVDAKNYKGCADAYIALFNRDKALPSIQGDELLYNASICLERSQQNKRAVRVLRDLVRLFPQSQFAARASERADALAAIP